jgi:hypothetical protein
VSEAPAEVIGAIIVAVILAVAVYDFRRRRDV